MDRNIFDTHLCTLSNGLKLITVKRDTQMIAVHAGIGVGAFMEEESEKGIAHFIEHMLFKGTKTKENEVLNHKLEQLGGEYNAYTEYSSTVVSVTALKEEIEDSLELVSDMLINSIFPEEEIEKERGVILAEIRTSKDDIEDLSFGKVNQMAFDKSALSIDVIGKEGTVNSFNRTDLLSFFNRYYCANNCTITIVSSYEHDYIFGLVKRFFSSWDRKNIVKKDIICEKNEAGLQVSYKKDVEQSTIIYLYTFHGLSKFQELALKILNHRLGGSSNSLLFRKLREERGLAYDIYSEIDLSPNIKTLCIYTAVSDDSIIEVLDIINSCINKLKSGDIVFGDDAISLMKKVLKTAIVSTMEDPTDLGNYILHQSIDGEDIFAFLEDMKNLEFVKTEHIYEVLRSVFNNPTIHILLPEKDD